jgi:hypothetical protein
MDETTNPLDIKCEECQSPCATCEGKADQCLSCDGSNNLTYSWEYKCYEECPNKTAPDMSTLRCLGCADNCNQCGTQEGPNCYECIPPYLLEEGSCKLECEVSGNRPNPEGTVCVDKTLFPVIGPIFTFITVVILIMVFIVNRFKKDTKFVTSAIALIGCIETLSIAFNLYLTVFHDLLKYTVFAALALIVSYILNIYNNWYVNNKVRSEDAYKIEQLKQKQVKQILSEISKKAKKWDKKQAREEMFEREEKKRKEEEARAKLE